MLILFILILFRLIFIMLIFLEIKMAYQCGNAECQRIREERDHLDAIVHSLENELDGYKNGSKPKLFCKLCGKATVNCYTAERHLAQGVSKYKYIFIKIHYIKFSIINFLDWQRKLKMKIGVENNMMLNTTPVSKNAIG